MLEQTYIPNRSEIIVRLLLARTLEASPIPSLDSLGTAQRNKIVSDLCALAREEAEISEPGRLDQLLARCCDHVEAYKQKQPPLNVSLKTRLDQFVSAARSITCLSCAHSEERICSRDNQYQDVTEQGLCLSIIREVFVPVEAHVRELYRSVCAHTSLEPEIHWALGSRTRDRQGGLIDQFHIEGETDIDRQKPIANVKLAMKLGFCGWNALLLLPYVLAHELICHAFQSYLSGEDHRKNAPSDCPWSEGWMDALAGHELAALFSRASLPSWLQNSASAAERISNAYQFARCQAQTGVSQVVADQRALGGEAYAVLVNAFTFASHEELARLTVNRTSLRLNAERIPKREELVPLLLARFDGLDFAEMAKKKKEGKKITLPPDILEFLARWREVAATMEPAKFLAFLRCSAGPPASDIPG